MNMGILFKIYCSIYILKCGSPNMLFYVICWQHKFTFPAQLSCTVAMTTTHPFRCSTSHRLPWHYLFVYVFIHISTQGSDRKFENISRFPHEAEK